MSLTTLVAAGTVVFWISLMVGRWLRVKPAPPDVGRTIFAAAGLSGAYIGGGYPLVWALVRNLGSWYQSGTTTFTFAGNLPPGVDEDDLLVMLVIGMAILVSQATSEAKRALD